MSEPFPSSSSGASQNNADTRQVDNASVTRDDADDVRIQSSLRRWAGKYIWWKTPDEALAYPARIIAQVMNLGVYSDVQEMVETLGPERLRGVLSRAEAGWLNARSWHYWHERLGLARMPDGVPPMPVRRVE